MSVDPSPTETPRPVALATAAVAAVGVATLALTATSAAPALGALSGGLLALGLTAFEGERTPTRQVARGVALVTASIAIGALVPIAGQAPGAADVSVSLAALLWLAALGGVGAGRGSLSSEGLAGGGVSAFAAFLSFGVLVPVFGGSILALAGVVAVLDWNAGSPAVGTVLALYGVAALATGAALGSTPTTADERRPINRQLRQRSAGAKRLGRRLLGVAGIAAIVGVLGGYELLYAIATPIWRALTIVTGSPLVRLVPIVVVGLAALAFVARAGISWAWDEDGADAIRITVLLSIVAAVALVGVVAGATAALVRLPGVGHAVVHPSALNSWSAVFGGVGGVLVGTALVLLGLRGVARASGRRDALGPYVCAGGLLAASVVVALRGSGVVAPLVAVGAAAIVWDVGRMGATMGAELGTDAAVERSALVRAGGSVAVGTLATVVAVALAVGLRRLGPLVERAVAGPVVLAVGFGAALVVALALYARKRGSAPL
ncbi:DUF7519 family protein [Natronoarchaeum rubrum]|uniref:DUF7519 family protein n=1 Tax=Natronoarchaeum rubrum TaxID=755311 RepID=UPI002113641E|nr:hypothetical protein [Natronoarchaeum rubrum]